MASAEKYSSGNASENFSVIFIKIVWFSTSNTIKTSVWFFSYFRAVSYTSKKGNYSFLWRDCPSHSVRHSAVPVARIAGNVS